MSCLVEQNELTAFLETKLSTSLKPTTLSGFSRTIIGLLNEKGAEFSSFDILSDEEVRAGLKEYSNWPTYPQLYLDGELLGGLDVVKEELQDSDFVSRLPKKA